jgi:hypothetical protein
MRRRADFENKIRCVYCKYRKREDVNTSFGVMKMNVCRLMPKTCWLICYKEVEEPMGNRSAACGPVIKKSPKSALERWNAMVAAEENE